MQAAIDKVDSRAHTALVRIMREYIFVGHLDGCMVLIQQASKLFTVDMAALSRDLCFQQALRRWRQFAKIVLKGGVDVSELVMMGLETQEANRLLSAEDGSKVCPPLD